MDSKSYVDMHNSLHFFDVPRYCLRVGLRCVTSVGPGFVHIGLHFSFRQLCFAIAVKKNNLLKLCFLDRKVSTITPLKSLYRAPPPAHTNKK